MNEIKLINVGGVDQNIKDQYVRDIIAPSENGLDSSTNLPVSSRHYDEGDYLIAQDRKYYEAITDIDVGDPLVVGTNIRATTVTDEILMLKGQSANVAIETIADMETAATASKAFTTGKYVYWNYGVDYGMYEVIADIAEGDAFVTTGVSQNIELANKIGDDVSLLKKTTTNHNLLDNPWFTVNQRGANSYTELNKYTLDRWRVFGNSSTFSIDKNTNGVTVSASNGDYLALEQRIEKAALLVGKTYTLSVIFDDGTVIKGTGLVSDVSVDTRFISTNTYIGKVEATLDYDSYNSLYLCRIFMNNPVSNLKIRAVKLELGSRSTLANDIAPDYTTELAKCQRYYVYFPIYGCAGYITNSSKDYAFPMHLPQPLRRQPYSSDVKLTSYLARLGTGGYSVHTGNAQVAPTSIKLVNHGSTHQYFEVRDTITTGVDTNNIVIMADLKGLEISVDL